jgi:hypothetical protein
VRPACFPGFEIPFSAYVAVAVDERGRLALASTRLLDALKGVRADRIRQCAVCARLFWAARTNSECCGLRCRKTFNKRQSRDAQTHRRPSRVPPMPPPRRRP